MIGICLCSILFFSQIDSNVLPEENPIVLQFNSVHFFSIDKVSSVLPDTLVQTTSVFLSTVFGSVYPFTTVVCISVLDNIDEKRSPIAPEPPIPEKTT